MKNRFVAGLLLASVLQWPLINAGAASPAESAAAQSADTYTAHDMEWRDDARQRDVPVRLYLPANASSAHPVPLVVFSHGIGGSRFGYSYLGKFWANQGFASLHLQHIGSDRSLWTGNPLTLSGRLKDAAQDSEAIARARDHHFALNQLLADSRFGAQIDSARIIAAGHSYGANTALLVAGAKVERNGQLLSFGDPRIKAAIILSAPPFYGETDNRKILGDVRLPSLHITSTDDVIRVPGYFSAANDRIAIYDSMGATSGARKVLAVFSGGSHSMFTDRAGTGGVLLNPQVKEATKELSLAFMKSIFEGEEAGLKSWPQRFRTLISQYAINAN